MYNNWAVISPTGTVNNGLADAREVVHVLLYSKRTDRMAPTVGDTSNPVPIREIGTVVLYMSTVEGVMAVKEAIVMETPESPYADVLAMRIHKR